jgi:hypothetical protein
LNAPTLSKRTQIVLISAADDFIAKQGPDSSSAADDSITKEGPDSSSVCEDNTETLLSMQKSDSAQPLKPLSSRKPETNWADETSDDSEEDVNMDKESGIDSSSIRTDHSLIRAEINPGFSVEAPDNAIVHESSSSANKAEARHISVASLFRSQSKENSPSASPSRARDSQSPVEHIDPKRGQADPRFVLTADIEAAIDLSQETEEETTCESLLHGHFKVLYDKGELNTVEEVKAAYMRVLGDAECNVSEDFLYDITLQLYQSADRSALPLIILWLHRNS